MHGLLGPAIEDRPAASILGAPRYVAQEQVDTCEPCESNLAYVWFTKRPYRPLAASAGLLASHGLQGSYLGIKWGVLQAPLSTQPGSTTLGRPELKYTMKLVSFSACHPGYLETACSPGE